MNEKDNKNENAPVERGAMPKPEATSENSNLVKNIPEKCANVNGRNYDNCLQNILNRLQKVKKSGDGYTALCPAHSDNNPSLSIKLEKELILVHCHAGCSFEEIVAAMGLSKSDFFVPKPKKTTRKANTTNSGDVVKQTIYPIYDKDGELIAEHFRKDLPDGNKTFFWRSNGKYGLGGLASKDLPFYHLLDLISAPQGSRVIVVEGEKACDALKKRSLLAVATVSGSKVTPSDKILQPLLDYQIVTWPDNDASGRVHMQQISQALLKLGLDEVRMIEWKDAPEKGDAADFVGTDEELERLISEAPAYISEAEPIFQQSPLRSDTGNVEKQTSQETELKDDKERIDASLEVGTVEAAFSVLDAVVRLEPAEYAVVKARLKEKCKINMNDFASAVKAERKKQKQLIPKPIPTKEILPPAPPATRKDVHDAFKKYLYLSDTGVIDICLATIVANHMTGDPVWLMLVAPPSVGKTEIIEPLGTLNDSLSVGTLTESGLLSATPARDRAKNATGGILRYLGEFGILILKDFGSILSMNKEGRNQVLAALREVYDGSWMRAVGSDGGQVFGWKGKIGVIAAVTPTIDRHHGVMATLGERFIFYRLSIDGEEERTDFALKSVGKEPKFREEVAEKVRGFLDNINIPNNLPDFSEDEEERIKALARFTAHCRSPVPRDSYTRDHSCPK